MLHDSTRVESPVNLSERHVDSSVLDSVKVLETRTDAAPGESFSLIERKVREVWEEVLGERDIPSDVEYWDLGHGALRAIRILQLIHEKIGVELPIGVLYESSTISGLASAIVTGKKTPFSRLVLLKSGAANHPALFIVGGIGAIVLELFRTGRAIQYAGPVYAFQPKGLNEGEVPDDSVAEMSASYIEAMKRVQPQGPYLLAGYSMGGYVAIEMARQLEAQNEDVPLVALLDSHAFEAMWPFHVWLGFMLAYPLSTLWRTGRRYLDRKRSKKNAMGWQEIAQSSSSSSSSSSGPPRVQAATSPRRETMDWILHSLQRFTIRFRNPRGRAFASRFAYYTGGLPPALQRVLENGFVLVAEYRPPYWEKEIVFFKSAQGDYAQCDPLKVWPRYFPRLKIHTVPGNHRSMLHGSNAVALAGEISKCLAPFEKRSASAPAG
jgi:thioesterase domain-containing protein